MEKAILGEKDGRRCRDVVAGLTGSRLHQAERVNKVKISEQDEQMCTAETLGQVIRPIVLKAKEYNTLGPG